MNSGSCGDRLQSMDEAVSGHLLPPRLDSPAACCSQWYGSTYNVLEEVHYGVLILGPAVLRLLRQGAVVGSSRCVMSILKERAWGAGSGPTLRSGLPGRPLSSPGNAPGFFRVGTLCWDVAAVTQDAPGAHRGTAASLTLPGVSPSQTRPWVPQSHGTGKGRGCGHGSTEDGRGVS